MNKQGKGKIEYLDYTWNPVTGCMHPCKDQYCYAAGIAHRFGKQSEGKKRRLFDSSAIKDLHGLERPCFYEGVVRGRFSLNNIDPYPFEFEPTFHLYKLDEPKKKKPSVIGVVYMGDLFGEWVPDTWIEEVLETVRECPQHTFLFLTKNPKRYGEIEFPDNCLVGTSITNHKDFIVRGYELYESAEDAAKKFRTFLSIEPLLGEIEIRALEFNIGLYNWVIIGQQTGPGAKPPKNEWVQSIIDQCRAAEVPVFVKSPLYERFPIQEWPVAMRK